MVKKQNKINESIKHFIAEIQKQYRIQAVYLYGSNAKGKTSIWSDIDLAIISPDFSDDLFEERLKLMKLAVNIDDRLEPHPFRSEDFDITNPLVHEIREHGIHISL